MSIGSDGFCREAALAEGQSLTATATASTAIWLLLEVREPWAAKAYEGAELQPEVRTRIDGWLQALGGSRIQLIRRESAREQAGALRFIVAWTGFEQPAWRAFTLASYADLLELDAPAVVDELQRGQGPDRREDPLALVCTHGKRDRCCAKWGLPIYQALQGADVEVWQTSHLGGHRFAPTVLTLPFGLQYGRLEPDEVSVLLERESAGLIALPERFRGRTCASEAEQLAEHSVRERLGDWTITGIRPMTHTRSRTSSADHARVVVETGADRFFDVDLECEPSTSLQVKSCGESAKPARAWTITNLVAR